jgi:hypothetical protein
MLLVESGARSIAEDLFAKLAREFPGLALDLITCYGGEPAGLAAHNGPECRFRVFHITDFAGGEGRARLGRQLRAEFDHTNFLALCGRSGGVDKMRPRSG